MFNERSITKVNLNGGSALSSGSKVGSMPTEAKQLRSKFAELQELQPNNINDAKMQQLAQLEGESRAVAYQIKGAVKLQGQVRKNLANIQGSIQQHVLGAAQDELKWQGQEGKFRQKLSPILSELGMVQATHEGFTSRLDHADRLINY